MRGLLCALVMFCVGIACAAQPGAAAPAKPDTVELRVGVLENFPPMHRWPAQAEAPSGFDIELLQILAERTGMRFRYLRFRDFVTLQRELLAGRIDLTPSIAMTPDRARVLRFTRPYVSVQQGFVGSDLLTSVPSTPDLSGRRVAVTRGHVSETIAAERFPAAARPVYDTVDDALDAVVRGDADVVFEALPTLRELIATPARSKLTVLRTFGFPQGHLRLAAPLRGAALVQRLDQAIAELPPDNIAELRARWFAPPAERAMTRLAAAGEAPLRVGYLLGDRPYTIKGADGSAEGIGIELMKAVARHAGLAIAGFEPFVLKDGLDALAQGRVDVMLGLTDIAERRAHMSFVGPYRANPVIIVSRKEYTVWDLDQLAGQRLALPAGYFGTPYLRAMHPTLTIVECARFDDCLDAVKAGRADAALYGLQGAYERLGARFGTTLQISGTVPGLFDEHNLGLALSRAHLAPVLRDALAVTLEKDFSGIEAAWAAREADRGLDWARLRTGAAIALAALALLALAWWWHGSRLARQIKRTDAARRDSEHYLAFMAHEVRNALQSVAGAVTVLRGGRRAAERRVMLDALGRTAGSTLGLLDALLDRHALQHGRLAVRLGAAQIEATLRALVDEAAPAALAKGLEVTYEAAYEAGHPPACGWWLIDELRVQQIVRNLLVNAIKFSARGRITVRATQQPSARGGDWRRIEIDVRDQGPGLDAAAQARLFQPFVATPGDRRGSGLGLALSRELVQAQGGTLQVTSSPGQGATFTLAFDAQPAARPSKPARRAPQRLLVVEDSPVYGLLLQQAFANLGIEVELAESVERARELLSAAESAESAVDPSADSPADAPADSPADSSVDAPPRFDLVLCDVHLEDGRVDDVLEHLSRLRRTGQPPPLLAMSAGADVPTERRVEQLGALALIGKDGDVAAFAARVVERAARMLAEPA